METDEWSEVEQLFHELSDLPPDEQRRRLEQVSRHRPVVGGKVRALLDDDARTSPFMERPVMKLGVRTEPSVGIGNGSSDHGVLTGRKLGPYRVVRPIASGGMGSIYLAERADEEFAQRVAIKIVRCGIDSPRLRERFLLERQTLAQLNHPNIARLLDGGTTPDGMPYLVMEYIDGVPIVEYCDRYCLAVAERLELFRTVCLAVHSAHRNLIVHRDLKPDNILVTPDGVLKLVDFGIAKIIDPEEAVHDVTNTRLLTPEFASPEQVRGEPVTTASDVYSLGVILYDLLTGARPYELGSCSPGEIEHVVCHQIPRKPSTAVTSDGNSRSSTPQRLRRKLQGDLDTIVMMALRKEPDRRYASAAELAQDISRYRDGLPIAARRDTVWYRARKFAGRNKVGVTAAALLAISVASSMVVIAWEARQLAVQRDAAEMEAASSRRVSDFLIEVFQVADPNEASGETITAREILDQAAERLDHEPDLDPAVQATLTNAIGRVYMNLGLYEPATTMLDQALDLRRRRFGDGSAEALLTLGTIGQLLYAKGDYEAAERALKEVLERQQSSGLEESVELAMTLNDLAATRRALGRTDGVEELYQQSLAMRKRLLGPNDPAVAESLNNLAGVRMAAGSLTDAREYMQQVLDIRRTSYGDGHPLVAHTLSNLAVIVHMQGDLAAAEPLYRDAVQQFRDALGDDHPTLASTLSSYGVLLQRLGDDDAAVESLREAIDIYSRQPGGAHPAVATSLTHLGNVLRATGDPEGARKALLEAIDIRRATLPEGHHQIARTLIAYGKLLLDLDESEAAESALREALEMYRKTLSDEHWVTAAAEVALAVCLRARQRPDEAEPLLLHGYEVLKTVRGGQDGKTLQAAGELVELYESIGRDADADRYRRLIDSPAS